MISLNLDHVCPHTYMRAIWGMNETFWSYAWETRYKEQAKCVGNHWIGFWMDAWEFRWFSIVVHIQSRVCLIYCLLPLNEPLPESYDLLVAWEIIVVFVYVSCLRVLFERPNTRNFQHVVRTQWIDLLYGSLRALLI